MRRARAASRSSSGTRTRSTVQKNGDETTYELGPAEGMLVARVPVYGKLRFLDRTGQPDGKGHQRRRRMDVPQLHQGRSLAAAIWTFDGITEKKQFPNGLPIEMTIEVFRTYKGDIEKGCPAA